MKLSLPEEIMLLALQDEKGTMVAGTHFQQAIGGAALAELILVGRIEVEGTKKKIVNLLDDRTVGDVYLDDCITKIKNAKRRASAQTWVQRFSADNKAKSKVATALCQKGVLKADEDKVLWIFTRKIYPELNPMPEKKMIARVQAAVFGSADDIDPRTVVLISLANASNLLKMVLDKDQRKTHKNRIKKIAEGDVAGKAVAGAVQAVQSAIMVATITPVIVSS